MLHAKEQEFRAIVENAPDQIIRYDRNFRRVYMNPAVAEAYGLQKEALIGKPIGSVIRDAGFAGEDSEVAQVRERKNECQWRSDSTTPYLKQLIAQSALPLQSIETDFAVDSSGFSTSTFALVRCEVRQQ